jgi:hypothetical protein
MKERIPIPAPVGFRKDLLDLDPARLAFVIDFALEFE